MRRALVILSLVASSPAAAQVAIHKQPADIAAWYHRVVSRIAARLPRPKQLLAMKPRAIPATLAADLLKYDWVVAGSYAYRAHKLDASYRDKAPCSFELYRYLPDGGRLRFKYDAAPCKDRAHGKVYHLNFKRHPVITASIKRIRGATYLHQKVYGKNEVHRIVRYRKGVLVIDITYDGKPGSRRLEYREVRVAVPRGFVSKGH